MTLAELLNYGRQELKEVSSTPNLEMEVLVKNVLGMSNEDLILKNTFEINKEDLKQIEKLIQRRKKQEPIAYLIKRKEFFGLDFYVDERVLIPRPETEILVESVLALVERVKLKGESLNFLILDVGTGSGCIPIALANNLLEVDFIGVDLSEAALSVAQQNIEKYALEKRVKLKKNDLLTGLDFTQEELEKNLILTANLPYVPMGDKLMSDVFDFEPHLALFSGEDGLKHYRKLLGQIQEVKPCAVFLEIDPRQVKVLKELSQQLLPDYTVVINFDLSGQERVFQLIRI